MSGLTQEEKRRQRGMLECRSSARVITSVAAGLIDALFPYPSTPGPGVGTPDIDLSEASAVSVEQVHDPLGIAVASPDVVPARLYPHRHDTTALAVPQQCILQTIPGGSTGDRLVLAHAVVTVSAFAGARTDQPASGQGEAER